MGTYIINDAHDGHDKVKLLHRHDNKEDEDEIQETVG